jgi:serralysin
MANNTYVVDLLVTGTQTITINDDGTGIDWLVIQGTYPTQTDLRLSWTTDAFGNSTSGMGLYFNPLNTGHRLVVNGFIENIRGSNGLDFIQGNEAGNVLFGDAAASGPGDADSLYGYDGNDTIYGGVGNDWIGGGNDNDRMFGNDGDDTISGGGGIDTVTGGAGADEMSGGSNWGDMLSYAGSGVGVRVDITYGSTTIGIGGHAQGDEIYGFTHVTGSNGADTIVDTVAGTIGGGMNDNAFYGGRGNDRLYMGGGADTAMGGDGNDRLFGEGDRDTLMGEAGNDILRGGAGADQLYGGADADEFEFAALADSTVAGAGRDTIRDFVAADGDRIDLSLIDARASTAGNNAFSFIGNAAFSLGVEGQLRVVQSGAGWVVSGDVNGDRTADFAIYVLSPVALGVGDFIL